MDSTPTAAAMYCRGCGYALAGLSENRCPECGRGFEPGKRKTFARSAREWVVRRWARRVIISACLLAGAFIVASSVTVAVLYWQWKAEQQIVAEFRRPGCHVTVVPLLEPWQQWVFATILGNDLPWQEAGTLGRAFSRLTERVVSIEYWQTTVRRQDLANIAQLRELGGIRFIDAPVEDAADDE